MFSYKYLLVLSFGGIIFVDGLDILEQQCQSQLNELKVIHETEKLKNEEMLYFVKQITEVLMFTAQKLNDFIIIHYKVSETSLPSSKIVLVQSNSDPISQSMGMMGRRFGQGMGAGRR